MDKTEITNLTEASGVSDNDYVMIDSPTLGVRKYLASNLQGGEPTLITKSITENGTYNAADDNADGYSRVIANVEPTITMNLNGGKVATSGGYYTTCPLDISLEAGNWYFVSLTDPDKDNTVEGCIYYSGAAAEFRLSRNGLTYDVRLNTATAGLYNYNGGSWRDMFMKVSLIPIKSSQRYPI